MATVSSCLWFNGQAEEAAELYVSLVPGSRVTSVSRYGEGASFPAGTAIMVEFELAGVQFQALNGGPQFPPSEYFSISLLCEDQAEVDALWDGLVSDGGEEGQCGWLKDRFGVSWQVVPRRLGELMAAGGESAGRVGAAMMGMSRLVVSELEATSEDTAPGETAAGNPGSSAAPDSSTAPEASPEQADPPAPLVPSPAGPLSSLTVALVPGVQPGKWLDRWAERRPDVPAVVVHVDEAAQLDALATAHVLFARTGPDGAPVRGREGLLTIPLYAEAPVAVLPREHVGALAEEMPVCALADDELLDVASLGYEAASGLAGNGAGVAVVPQAVARVFGRRDTETRPLTDTDPGTLGLESLAPQGARAELLEGTRVWLCFDKAWQDPATGQNHPVIEEFVGIVRGRRAESSRQPSVQERQQAEAQRRLKERQGSSSSVDDDGAAGRGRSRAGGSGQRNGGRGAGGGGARSGVRGAKAGRGGQSGRAGQGGRGGRGGGKGTGGKGRR
ncbi:VOC family protein [Falsarthrobacter nasiphocae]|uniref:3-demethylubiquinone-9 3-methyltransferase (Glyoxalase superfamily) n=1 Tax=Falsarthrobacter nasiphocae TaxID=189863 RepID=A0AAE4C840_9MICC|nr:VOC family protein [Falsarthrobacter nasiphocae]MDR6892015.1 putative 3-demethylubiquinone-9 3-methyltransferase (glyoxalase superfamily) [Falsarthrobacter nasiphocae]